VPELHQRASTWHRTSGSADQAIEHALAAGDIAGSVDLAARHWYAYVDSGQAATVKAWIGSLGDDTIGAYPIAAHCAAWTAALLGDQHSVHRWLPVIEAATDHEPLPDGMRSLRSSASLLRAAFGFDGIGPMRDAAAQAVLLENDPASPWFALAQASFAAALYWCGDLERAAEHARQALLSQASIALVRIQALAVMALVAGEQGRLAQAEELALSAHAIATDNDLGLGETPQSAIAHTALGAAYAAGRQLQNARGEFEHALRIRRRWLGISPWPTLEIQLRLAPVLLDLGDPRAATLLLDEARQMLTSLPDGAEAQVARLDRIAVGQPQVPYGEQLTEREAAVLRLLRGTLSLREIGQQLYVSQNTIKTHTRAIYRKLGVSTRQQAVAKIQEDELR
jgi:ATP/maltotriose-dependent transcriptional regulator MalT